MNQARTGGSAELKFAKSAYWYFLFWGVCSALGTTLCTLVDAILVGNLVGSDGLAATGIATPVFLTYALLGMTLGVGASVRIGRDLGSANVEEANRRFHSVLLTGLIVGLGCMAATLLLRQQILDFLGAQDNLRNLSEQYLTVVFVSAPIFVLYHIMAAAVRTDGGPALAAVSSAVVIVVNLSLDFVFMKGLNWGIVGASASLCIGEILGLLVLLSHFFRKRALLRLGLRVVRWEDLKKFVVNGFGVGSAFIFQAIVMFTFNILLLASGDGNGVTYVAIFGVMYTMSTIPAAIFDGAGNAISTVVSIFAGEKDSASILTTMRQGLKIVVAGGILVAAIFALKAPALIRFFGITDQTALDLAVPAVRVYVGCFLFMGVNALATAFWQAIGRARLAGGMSIARNFVLMLVLGMALISQMHIVGLSLTYVITEALCLIGVVVIHGVSSSNRYTEQKYASTGQAFEKVYTISTDSITEIANDLEQVCDQWEIDYKKAFFIHLIVEELILNIIKFGLRDTRRVRSIAIRLLDNEGECILRIRDNVRTYNPFDSSGDDIDNAVIGLITKKTQFYSYQRKLIFNYLYLIL